MNLAKLSIDKRGIDIKFIVRVNIPELKDFFSKLLKRVTKQILKRKYKDISRADAIIIDRLMLFPLNRICE